MLSIATPKFKQKQQRTDNKFVLSPITCSLAYLCPRMQNKQALLIKQVTALFIRGKKQKQKRLTFGWQFFKKNATLDFQLLSQTPKVRMHSTLSFLSHQGPGKSSSLYFDQLLATKQAKNKLSLHLDYAFPAPSLHLHLKKWDPRLQYMDQPTCTKHVNSVLPIKEIFCYNVQQ